MVPGRVRQLLMTSLSDTILLSKMIEIMYGIIKIELWKRFIIYSFILIMAQYIFESLGNYLISFEWEDFLGEIQ